MRVVKPITIYFSVPVQVFITHNIKMPAMEAIKTLFNPKASIFHRIRAIYNLLKVFQAMGELPEPTLENTWHPNSHNLIRLRDWLFERCFLNSLRLGLVRRLINFVIILYDFDPPWRWVMDSVKDEALKMDWKPRGFEDDWISTYKWWQEKDA